MFRDLSEKLLRGPKFGLRFSIELRPARYAFPADSKFSRRRNRQGGFSLVAGVFLLVIFASLAVFLMSISTMHQVGSAKDLQGSRAFQAARAGVEWGAFQSLRNGACAGVTLTFPGTTLSDFSTTVTCATTAIDEVGAATLNVDRIIATACNQAPCPNGAPGQNYIERQITITVNR